MRDNTACMMRCKNEQRFIRRSLERTFQVCQRVVIWDDGSEDNTEQECILALGDKAVIESQKWGGWIGRGENALGPCELHFLYSPFVRDARQPNVRVNEIRDKRTLWSYVQTAMNADIFLCLDGDEHLSLQAIRKWPESVALLNQGYDLLDLNFIYIWQIDSDGALWQRYDGLYGPAPEGVRSLHFPRIFSTRHVLPDNFFMMTFAWIGSHSFHCGSIPRANFLIGENNDEPRTQLTSLEVVHWGYCEDEIRRKKTEFYRRIDPGNTFEGNYNHCVGEPDQWCPGPVALARYQDV